MTEEFPYSLGALDSPDDPRDFMAGTVYDRAFGTREVLPVAVDHRDKLTPIRSQGQQGACVAFTVCAMKEFQELINIDYKGYFAPQFIYDQRPNFPQAGMYPRDAMKLLHSGGVCAEQLYPYGYDEERKPSEDHRENAGNHKIKSYAKVSTMKDLKRALYHDGPCYVTFPVYHHGERFWKPRKEGDAKVGAHAVLIISYNDLEEKFVIRNSWGTGWGQGGYCDFPYEDFGMQREIWTSIDDEFSKKLNYDEDPDPRPDPQPNDNGCKCVIV